MKFTDTVLTTFTLTLQMSNLHTSASLFTCTLATAQSGGYAVKSDKLSKV